MIKSSLGDAGGKIVNEKLDVSSIERVRLDSWKTTLQMKFPWKFTTYQEISSSELDPIPIPDN